MIIMNIRGSIIKHHFKKQLHLCQLQQYNLSLVLLVHK